MSDVRDSDEQTPKHPIQVVALRTGLTAHAIRAWERRYGAVAPTRSPTGRRLYSDAQVERLRLLRQAVSAGRRIGDIARFERETLDELVREDGGAPAAVRGRRAAGDAGQHLQACVDAVHGLDPVALASVLGRARVALGLPALLEQVVGPLMAHTGDGCRSGTLRIANEHLASAVLRSVLGPLAQGGGGGGANDPWLLVTTPSAQVHELGALIAAVDAAAGGWRPLYLGANTPAEEIAYSALAHEVRAVVLSIVYPADDPHLPDELVALRGYLGPEVPVLVGGGAASAYGEALERIDARVMHSLAEFRKALDGLRHTPAAPG